MGNQLGLPDPFYGYSTLLNIIIYVLLPLFGGLQFFRLRRALHVFQLEGYKRRNFLSWTRAHRDRSMWMRTNSAKKPLAMTGRAWRILVLAVVLSVLAVFGSWATAHLLLGGWPLDVIAYLLAAGLVFYFSSSILTLSDWALTPVQSTINGRYLRAARARLDSWHPLVIGVTGSYGKTSTKFFIERLVAPGGVALATPGSYNTTMGVVRTINENLRKEHRYLIVEMGAKQRGDIAELVEFTRPHMALLTAIGPAHLESFGSLDNVRKAKYEIVAGLREDGVAVMNTDDPEVRALADDTQRVKVIRYGLDPEGAPHVSARGIETTSEGTSFSVVDTRSGEGVAATTTLLGRHSISNVLGAVAVALEAGRSLAELAGPIRRLTAVEHRLQIIKGAGGVTVIDDAFNSNPDGAAAALDVVGAMPGGHKVVVTPGMVELGELQAEANERFGEHAGRVADTLIVVARVNREALVAGAQRSNRARVVVVDTLAQAQEEMKSLLGPGDVVLFENDLPDQYEG
ncbi:MAG: UDP-N-acetylmuramoyl-tripeptide--D-alanyl-D-alanine ligase [Actinomycetota bacterium]